MLYSFDLNAVSAVFKGPTEKKKVKVNLYDPHQQTEKPYYPGPGDYFKEGGSTKGRDSRFKSTMDSFKTAATKLSRCKTSGQTRRTKAPLNSIPGTIGNEITKQPKSLSSVFLLSNTDRFGETLYDRKTKPKEMIPSPGAYNAPMPKRRVKHALIGKLARATSQRVKRRAPGPAYYKPMMDPKMTSYHLNVQNTWMC